MTTKRRSPGRLRRLLGRLGLLCASLLVMFAVLEIGFRVFERFSTGDVESWAMQDEDLGYRTRPGFLGTNEHGLLDDPIETPKSRFRILMLGDSIPFYGDGPADTFVGRLESGLNAAPTLVPSEVINAGIKGYTNYQQARYLEKYGLAFEPDLVGVSFCLNDLHRFAHHFVFDENGEVIGQGYDFTDEAVESVGSPLYRLARKSRFLVWMRRRLSVFDGIVNLAARGGYTFDYRPDFNTAWKDEPWVDVERQLAAMKRLGDEHGFPLFVVVFPFGEQLRADYLERDREYVLKPQRKLAEICARLDIPLLDLFDDIDRDKHLLDDLIHLTPEGRGLAAVRIGSFLVERGLVPRAED